jgi:hypothetical protein
MTEWRHLKGKHVAVHAFGTVYRGVVVELGAASLLLKGVAGALEVPWERVTRVEETEAPKLSGPSSLAQRKTEPGER